MGIPLTIQPDDNERLIQFKSLLKAKSKVEVLRQALDSLEDKLRKQKRHKQWRAAARRVAVQSERINRDFQKHSLIKR